MPSIGQLRETIESCKKCGGSGVTLEQCSEGLKFVDCNCMLEIKDSIVLMKANIPDQYWGYSLDKLSPAYKRKNKAELDKVQTYLDNLDRNIKAGKGMWFCSTPGLGKSTVMSCILKEAIDGGHKAYFIRASHMISMKFDALRDKEASELVSYIVNDVDILAVEELEKIYLLNDDAMNNQLFYEFISDVYDSKKAILVSSNQPKKEVMIKFPTFVQDRLRPLPQIIFRGKSERAKKK